MSFLYRHFYHRFRVPDQATDFPHRFSSLSINPSEGNVEDDWELLEILDQEFGDMDMGPDNGDAGDIDMGFPFATEDLFFTSHHKIKLRIRSKADVRAHLEDKVQRVTMVLALSRNDALILLHKFKWSVERTQEEWLTREEEVRNSVGLYEKPVTDIPYSHEISCGLCLASLKAGTLYAVSCGHHFCQKCWTEINKGPECLTMRCPGMSCKAAVGLDMVELMASQEENKTFDHYLIRSSIAGSKKEKWCPAPDCEFAIDYSTRSDDSTDVTCCCFHSFCWSCSKEAHAPVECATAVEWKSESFLQSNNWILANTRPCQKCGNLMDTSDPAAYLRCATCSNFRYQGVNEWTCKAAESFEADSLIADPSDDDRERARKSLERFNEYYQGWSVSEAARANALTDLEVLQKLQLEILCNVFYLDESEFEFLVEAQKQVIHCWRLLKWMYVYGYYLPEDENNKRALFEFMQDQALRLVCLLAKNVPELLNSVQWEHFCLTQYEVFRRKILRLTRVTIGYLDRFVEGVKSGLTEVMPISEKSPRPNFGEASCSSSSPCSGPTQTGLKETQDQDLFFKSSPCLR